MGAERRAGDRALADIFDLQDEMTATIVGAIEPELRSAEGARAKRKPSGIKDADSSRASNH